MAHPSKACGSCTLCCRILQVPDLPAPKPEGEWCTHCNIGKGCRIYADRPVTCRVFECHWLQAPPEAMGDEVRPDRCGVVLTAGQGGDGVVALCDARRPTAWRHPGIMRILRKLSEAGMFTAAKAGKRFWAIGSKGEWEVPADKLKAENETVTMVGVPAAIAREIGFRGRYQAGDTL